MRRVEAELQELVNAALGDAQLEGSLPMMAPVAPPQMGHAKRPEWGDYSTAWPLQLASSMRLAPIEVARVIQMHLAPSDLVASSSVTPPGFVNFVLSTTWLAAQGDAIRAVGASFADTALGSGRRAQVEYVSANPTGPLTVGHGRTGVIGDATANILAAAGFEVTREFYYNNAGKQMRSLGESLRARYLQALGRDEPLPEGGYQGDYLIEVARRLVAETGAALEEADWVAFKDVAEAEMAAGQRATLGRLGIHMDVFFNEASLYETGAVRRTLDDLRERGFVYERDGATWLKATDLGGTEDRVIVKSTGEPTYRLPDIAYHVDKLDRGFDLIVDVLGADHKDAFPDVVRGVEALGRDASGIRLLMNQFVTFKGERMSKRAGRFMTLDDLVDDVGPDVTRFFLLMRAPEAHLEFDLDLALEQSEKNPVYYVQYAHARICSILRLAVERGFSGGADSAADADASLLVHPMESALIRRLLGLSEVIDQMARDLTPHALTTYARDLASDFHAFYRDCRVLDADSPQLSAARLRLVDAARLGLARTLELIGVSAPESM
jgi:arginyl-tRNA synthetase